MLKAFLNSMKLLKILAYSELNVLELNLEVELTEILRQIKIKFNVIKYIVLRQRNFYNKKLNRE